MVDSMLNLSKYNDLQAKDERQQKTGIDSEIFETIDMILSTLGPDSKEAIYWFMEQRYDLKKEDLPCKITDFSEAIVQIFGPASEIIEKRIIQVLSSKHPDFVYEAIQEPNHLTKFISRLRIHLSQVEKI